MTDQDTPKYLCFKLFFGLNLSKIEEQGEKSVGAMKQIPSSAVSPDRVDTTKYSQATESKSEKHLSFRCR